MMQTLFLQERYHGNSRVDPTGACALGQVSLRSVDETLEPVSLSGGDVTVTEGDDEGSGTGTPADDGGCLESSDITVGDETYRAQDGKMQWENDNGDWIDMTETTCDADGASCGDTETIGSLPFAKLIRSTGG